jgi:hypothetical protein
VRHDGCRFVISFDGHHACALWQRSVALVPNVSKPQATVVFLHQKKAEQVSHVARRQVLRL